MTKCTSFLFFCARISTEFSNPHIASIKHLIYSICNQFLHRSYIQPLIHKYMAINPVVKHKLYHIHKDPGKDGEPLWRKIWCDGIGNNLFTPDNSVACVCGCAIVSLSVCVLWHLKPPHPKPSHPVFVTLLFLSTQNPGATAPRQPLPWRQSVWSGKPCHMGQSWVLVPRALSIFCPSLQGLCSN